MSRKLVLIRHGKTAGNLEKRYVGSTDEPLLKKETEKLQKIRKQAILLRDCRRVEREAKGVFLQRPSSEAASKRNRGNTGRGARPDQQQVLRISGTDPAAVRLEEVLAELSDVPCLFTSPMKRTIETAGLLFPEVQPVIVADFRECDFGAFEYRNYKELSGDCRYQRWIDSGGKLPFPDGESLGSFQMRSWAAFQDVIQNRVSDTSEDVVLVVHGGTIMSVLSRLCGGDYFSYQVENLGGFVLPMPKWR